MTTTYTYDSIVETTETAVKFSINDLAVWLPRNGLTVNTIDKTVASNLLDKQMRQARAEGKSVDLGGEYAPTKTGKSVFYRATLTLDQGDPEFSTYDIAIFVPMKLHVVGMIPLWLVLQSVEREIPNLGKADFTIRNTNGDPVYVSADDNGDPVVEDDSPEAAEEAAAVEVAVAEAAGPDADAISDEWDGTA